MQELTYFYLNGCPHCRDADRWLQEICAEEPALAAVPIRRVEERENAPLADQYDYWYVPCLYLGQEKLIEGPTDRAALRAALQRAAQA